MAAREAPTAADAGGIGEGAKDGRDPWLAPQRRRGLRKEPPDRPGGISRRALSAEKLGVRARDGHELVADVSLVLAVGERLAIIGPNGAGKTTLPRAGRHPAPAQRADPSPRA